MSKKKAEELKYFEKLNISVLSIAKIKELIKFDIKGTINAWQAGHDVDKQCFHIIGPAGVGKTEVCFQIADELTTEIFGAHNIKNPDKMKNFEVIMIKAPVLSRDDFIIPFPIIDNGNTSFKMLYSDFVPKDTESYGIFVIDEFSRGDHSLQQLLWQVQNEYKLHLLDFPKNWFVVSIDNPDDQEYQMDTMEDSAGLRRQLHIYTEVSAPDFLHYAIEQKFHTTVIEFIQTHPDYLYDFDAQKIGSVFANPASYEKLSDHMKKLELAGGGFEAHYDKLEALASGLLNTAKARLFIDFVRDGKDINPKDIVFDYKKVRPTIKKFLKENDNAALGNLMTSFITYLTTSKPKYEAAEKKNLVTFFTDIPLDTAAIYVTTIDSFDRKTAEFKYVTSLHVALSKDPAYKVMFYEAIVKCGREEDK